MPAPVSVSAGTGVPFLNNASMPVWQASGVGADQVADCGVHRTIFGCGGHASRQVEANVVRIAVSVYGDLLPSAASDPERACSFSPHSRDSCIESTCHVSYRIALLDAQSGALAPVSPEKQPPQIGHLAAHKRKQLWVRAGLAGSGLMAGHASDSATRDEFSLAASSRAVRYHCVKMPDAAALLIFVFPVPELDK